MSISIPYLNILNPFFSTYLCWSGILITLAHTLIALTHPNSTEKLHRLQWALFSIQENLHLVAMSLEGCRKIYILDNLVF